jgi:hypothetical protein
MFAIIYGILGEDKSDNLFIDGPFFYKSHHDHDTAEILARELAATKTKNQIIPWVFESESEDELIPDLMIRVRDGWFNRFKQRTMETYQTIQKDQENATCPFVDVEFTKFSHNLGGIE